MKSDFDDVKRNAGLWFTQFIKSNKLPTLIYQTNYTKPNQLQQTLGTKPNPSKEVYQIYEQVPTKRYKQAQLGVPQSEIQVELDLIDNQTGGDTAQKYLYWKRGTPHIPS